MSYIVGEPMLRTETLVAGDLYGWVVNGVIYDLRRVIQTQPFGIETMIEDDYSWSNDQDATGNWYICHEIANLCKIGVI